MGRDAYGNETIKCELCGEEFLRINAAHLLGRHGISVDEYCERFPDAKLVAGCDYVGRFDQKVHMKEYNATHKEERRKWNAEHAAERKAWQKAYDDAHKEERRETIYGRLRTLRYEALSHYSGGGAPKCVGCGIGDIDVLCIDHIDGLGTAERMPNTRFYVWLKENGYPKGYQTLCRNCNFKKEMVRRRQKNG